MRVFIISKACLWPNVNMHLRPQVCTLVNSKSEWTLCTCASVNKRLLPVCTQAYIQCVNVCAYVVGMRVRVVCITVCVCVCIAVWCVVVRCNNSGTSITWHVMTYTWVVPFHVYILDVVTLLHILLVSLVGVPEHSIPNAYMWLKYTIRCVEVVFSYTKTYLCVYVSVHVPVFVCAKFRTQAFALLYLCVPVYVCVRVCVMCFMGVVTLGRTCRGIYFSHCRITCTEI